MANSAKLAQRILGYWEEISSRWLIGVEHKN